MEISPLIPSPDPHPPASNAPRMAVLAGLLLCALLAFIFWRMSIRTAPPQPSPSATSPETRAYLASVAVENLEVARAENFLHQEVTTVSGEISNAGNRALANVEVTVEFFDQLDQIAQRESRNLFGPADAPVPPAGRHPFEISFDHISSAWNMQAPHVKVTGVEFTRIK